MAQRLGDVLDLLLGEPARAPAVQKFFAVPLAPGDVLRRRAVSALARALAPGGLSLRVTARASPWPEPRVLLFVSADPGERREAREAIAQRAGRPVALLVDGVRSVAEARAVAWELAVGRPGVRLVGALCEERNLVAALLLGRATPEWAAVAGTLAQAE